MREQWTKEDFIGFAYNGIHSSQFGLVSVTTNNRYQRALFADIQDVTTTIAGRDGVLYYGTNRGKKTFPFSLAFDGLMEDEYLGLAAWLQVESGELILDERPYVKYNVKLASAPVIEFVPFTDQYGRRVYKGELNISFVCYEGYGYCVEKWADNYSTTGFTGDYGYNPLMVTHTGAEWLESSRLHQSQLYNGVTYDESERKMFNNGDKEALMWNVYNPGEVATEWNVTLYADDPGDGATPGDFYEGGATCPSLILGLYRPATDTNGKPIIGKGNRISWLRLKSTTTNSSGWYWNKGEYQIDSKKRTIQYRRGDVQWTNCLHLWDGGDFFDLPVSKQMDEGYWFICFAGDINDDKETDFDTISHLFFAKRMDLVYNYKYY